MKPRFKTIGMLCCGIGGAVLVYVTVATILSALSPIEIDQAWSSDERWVTTHMVGVRMRSLGMLGGIGVAASLVVVGRWCITQSKNS